MNSGDLLRSLSERLQSREGVRVPTGKPDEVEDWFDVPLIKLSDRICFQFFFWKTFVSEAALVSAQVERTEPSV